VFLNGDIAEKITKIKQQEVAYEAALAAGLSEAEAEACALRSYDWRLLSHDFLSFGLRIKILISTLLLLSHTSRAIIPIISP
jgi:hypothetical protein